MKIFVIECRTGCSCCGDSDNHYRGFFDSIEAAQRRIVFFQDPKAKNNPVASQYARKGSYNIEELEAEEISGGRVILWEDRVFKFDGFAVVAEDGSATGENDFRYQ